MQENTRLIEEKHNISLRKISKESLLEAWGIAKDVVDYPVHIVPAYYEDYDNGEFVRADGESGTGREKDFHLVVVDKYRNGDKQVISTVTGLYGTLQTKTVYEELQEQLMAAGAEISHDLVHLYVSGNGGQQQLTLRINDVIGMGGFPDEIAMYVQLTSSVDGSKLYTMQTIVHNKTSDTTYFFDGEANYKLAVRHTNTINERAIHFIPTIKTMIENWNSVIIPTMSLMYDNKFNREVALDLITKICAKAGIGERHASKILDLYRSGGVKTNAKEDSLYRVNHVFGEYIDNKLESRELQNRLKEGVAKAVDQEVRKLKNAK